MKNARIWKVIVSLVSIIALATPAQSMAASSRSVTSFSYPILFNQIADENMDYFPSFRSDVFPWSYEQTTSFEVVDDFVVPSSEKWRIQGVRVLGVWTKLPREPEVVTIPTFQLNVREDVNGAPGKLIFSRAVTDSLGLTWNNLYPRFAEFNVNSPISLNPGRYWFTIMSNNQQGVWYWYDGTLNAGSKPLVSGPILGRSGNMPIFSPIIEDNGMEFAFYGAVTSLRPSCPPRLTKC